jgi:hypothetical protein
MYMFKGNDLPLTRADINKIPYASIAVRLGEASQALLILDANWGQDRHWMSADHEVIVTRRGRLVQTEGLPQDVTGTIFLTADPVGGPSDGFAATQDCVRTLDFTPYHQTGVVVRSRFENGGRGDIEILGNRIATQIWQEHGEASEFAWSFVNTYWTDPDSGFVWKSVQATTPALPPLEITVYRRPA